MISLCITTYNRTELLFRSFAKVVNHPAISEIVIVDDHSDPGVYEAIEDAVKVVDKVRLFRNGANLDCYHNKAKAISLAKNDWVIILDSDNVIDNNYMDAILFEQWQKDTVFMPSFAKPHFNYLAFAGMTFDKSNIAEYIDKKNFDIMLNCMNYFVHRETYLDAWDSHTDPVTADSIYQNYNILKNGGKIKVVRGMEYEHKIHSGSHYKNNNQRTPSGFYDGVIAKLKALR